MVCAQGCAVDFFAYDIYLFRKWIIVGLRILSSELNLGERVGYLPIYRICFGCLVDERQTFFPKLDEHKIRKECCKWLFI